MNLPSDQTPPMNEAAQWFGHADEAAWSLALAHVIADALRADLARHDRVLLLVSGGSTPAPVLAQLAQQVLDWKSVIVSLVDERWTQADAAGSNSRQARDWLLRDRAEFAEFWPLVVAGLDPDACVHLANQRLRAVKVPVSVVLLGMGSDAHIASLFPDARNLDQAWSSPAPYVSIDATGVAVARPWPLRISLTPAGLAMANTRFLLLRGQDKRQVFERASSETDAKKWPVRTAFGGGSTPLQVHWCP